MARAGKLFKNQIKCYEAVVARITATVFLNSAVCSIERRHSGSDSVNGGSESSEKDALHQHLANEEGESPLQFV